MTSRAKDKALQVTLVIVVFVLFLAVWETCVRYFDVPFYTLPRPSTIAAAVWEIAWQSAFWKDVYITLLEAFWGYIASIAIAIIFGVLISQNYLLNLSLMPYIVAFQTIPSIALAPIYLQWFGFGMASKIALAITIACFPIMINVIAGLQATNTDQAQMLRAFGATRLQILRKLTIPNALPHFFTGLKLGIVMALTGALVSEFVGSKAGLGFRIQQCIAQFEFAQMFGVLFVLSVIGIFSYALISLLRRRIIFWEKPYNA